MESRPNNESRLGSSLDKDRRTYSLDSEAYAHGFMQGEALELGLPI